MVDDSELIATVDQNTNNEDSDDGQGKFARIKPHANWRLATELTLVQAALLMANVEPSNFQYLVENNEDEIDAPHAPHGYEGAKRALILALINKEIAGKLQPRAGWERAIQSHPEVSHVDVEASTVPMQSLKSWLHEKNSPSEFFSDEEAKKNQEPAYLDPEHPRYAGKLAAAVRAWEALESEQLLKRKTPKQALERWLVDNAADFRLVDSNGRAIDSAIEQCATVANWKPKGGAAKLS